MWLKAYFDEGMERVEDSHFCCCKESLKFDRDDNDDNNDSDDSEMDDGDI
jgi:hypothetical protein